MEFRLAVPGELDAVCQLYRTAAQSSFSVWNESYPSRLEAEHDLETGNLFVLIENGLVIGTLSIVPESEMENLGLWHLPSETHREIARVAISAEYQGKGLAVKMVSSIFPILLKRGYTSVRLSVACSNLPACKTYRKLGFEIRGEEDLYGSRYYLMERSLL